MTAMTTPPSIPDAERADLIAALATARAALTNTVRGLSDEQAGERPTASALCLGGLIKHVASIEGDGCASSSTARRRCATTCPTASPGPTSRPVRHESSRSG